MILEPNVWGPHYWFVLHTIAISYPLHPNEVTKKKYYDLIHNFPLFLPIENIGNIFSKIIDKYPVSPYLDSRESFIKWTHFIHNKVNVSLGKDEITMEEALSSYYNNYKPKQITNIDDKIRREKIIYMIIIILIICVGIYLYTK